MEFHLTIFEFIDFDAGFWQTDLRDSISAKVVDCGFVRKSLLHVTVWEFYNHVLGWENLRVRELAPLLQF